MVLGAGEGGGGFAVAEGEEADFLTFEHFLDDDAVAGRAEGTGETFVDRVHGFLLAGSYDDTFTGGEAIGFYHDRHAVLFDVGAGIVAVIEAGVAGGGDVVGVTQLLGEIFRGFNLRARFGRSEDVDFFVAQAVGEAHDQRLFVADDDEVDGFGFAVIDDVRMGEDIDAGHVLRDAAIAGGAGDEFAARRREELAHHGMFAAAAADD